MDDGIQVPRLMSLSLQSTERLLKHDRAAVRWRVGRMTACQR
jgi:hypothetical protein